MKGARVKGIYGKPWSRMVGQPIVLDANILNQLGQAIVDAVVAEARKDFAKQGKAPRIEGTKKPEGLPDTESFFRSFSYRISGKSTVELLCSWPYIDQITEGRGPYPMPWLTRDRGVNTVPILKDGVVVFRTTPLKISDAWIHPGFARHTFIQRGVRKGREAMSKIMAEAATKVLMKGDIFR